MDEVTDLMAPLGCALRADVKAAGAAVGAADRMMPRPPFGQEAIITQTATS